MCLGALAAKCVVASSIISPAPTKSTRILRRSSNSCAASRTAAAAMLMECEPISVEVRTSLATEKLRWNSWCSVVPSVPAESASRTACFIWPRICGSPSTIESSPEATRKAWRAAAPCSSTWVWRVRSSALTPPWVASHSRVGRTRWRERPGSAAT